MVVDDLKGCTGHSGHVVETLIAAFGSVVALGALVVSLMAHRHQVARAAALDDRESRVEARELAVVRREARVQASMIEVRTGMRRSDLHPSWVNQTLQIVNPSNQPILLHSGCTRGGRALPDVSGRVDPGATRHFRLPGWVGSNLSAGIGHGITIVFTDAGDIRWRRDAHGGLQRGLLGEGGAWEWGEREDPVITESRAPVVPEDNLRIAGPVWGGAVAGSTVRYRRSRPRKRALALAALVAVAILVGTVVVLWW
ncbi:hypothetical protein [Streptomyces sp. LN590]|uniref:hypothetical protein n=1 Tax=Streptomyces sp. LN590 TaxID=3112980 RepID=UPI00371AC15B